MNPDNNVPLGNGRVLVWLSQYDGYRPVDKITQAFYPDYDLSSSALGDEGITVLVNDENERIWYDPHGIVRMRSGQLGEVVSVDHTRFVEGTGVYEVLSHKGNTVVRSTTWVPPGCNGFVRRFDVSTVKRNASKAWMYPVLHMKNVVKHAPMVYLSRLSELRWMAVTTVNAVESDSGPVSDFLMHQKLTTGYHGSMPGHVTFKSAASMPEGGFSDPVCVVVAFGANRGSALREMEKIQGSPDCFLQETLDWWKAWHEEGAILNTCDKALEYLWKTSLTLARMSMQENAAPVLIGFRPYQGNVWLRDAVWVSSTLAMTGHANEAKAIMSKLKSIICTRADGGFCFSYNCTVGDFTDHTFENDSMGLLIYGYWCIYQATGESDVILENLDLITYCADWILQNRDDMGLVKPCAGISEVFGPHLERDFEHMTWTSGISAFGLRRARDLLKALGKHDSQGYAKAASDLVGAILRNNTREGIMRRSMESEGLDASCLLFYAQFPLLPKRHPVLEKSLEAMSARLVDPFLGGVWRYDELITEEGDLRPWTFYTLALGEAYLTVGEPQRAWDCFEQGLRFASYCGLLPELVYTHDLVRGIAMPSLSQCGLLRFLLSWVNDDMTLSGSPPVRFAIGNLLRHGHRFQVEPAPACDPDSEEE